jgi:hypothetical protein
LAFFGTPGSIDQISRSDQAFLTAENTENTKNFAAKRHKRRRTTKTNLNRGNGGNGDIFFFSSGRFLLPLFAPVENPPRSLLPWLPSVKNPSGFNPRHLCNPRFNFCGFWQL